MSSNEWATRAVYSTNINNRTRHRKDIVFAWNLVMRTQSELKKYTLCALFLSFLKYLPTDKCWRFYAVCKLKWVDKLTFEHAHSLFCENLGLSPKTHSSSMSIEDGTRCHSVHNVDGLLEINEYPCAAIWFVLHNFSCIRHIVSMKSIVLCLYLKLHWVLEMYASINFDWVSIEMDASHNLASNK